MQKPALATTEPPLLQKKRHNTAAKTTRELRFADEGQVGSEDMTKNLRALKALRLRIGLRRQSSIDDEHFVSQ